MDVNAPILHYLPRESGLYLFIPSQNYWSSQYIPCSLTGITAKVIIVDSVARVTLSQTFSNNYAKALYEAVYRFPLYENSAVCAFELEHSGRKIKGIVQAEAEAIKTYETAKAEGKTAALVLQKEPDIFQTKVGNIPPETSVTVTLTYITPLKNDTESNAIRFTLPTVIANRYGDASKTGSSNVSSGKTNFELSLEAVMAGQITSVSSPSHPIEMTLNNATSATVALSTANPVLDKDLVILIRSKNIDEPRCVIESDPKSNTKCAMFTLIPKFDLPRVSTEIIFIIDRSGSMEDKVATLKKALQLFLKSLPASPPIYFNICSFGSHFDFLFKGGKSQQYDAKTLKTAEAYVSKVDANYGGTEILSPLLECMKTRRTDCQTSIILLTDGEVYDTSAIISAIAHEKSKDSKKRLRIFSLGIGDAVSHHLVEGIARAGGGYSQFVMANERLDKKVVRMLAAGLQSPIDNLHLDWPGKPADREMMYNLVKRDSEEFEVVDKEVKPSSTFFDKTVDDTETMRPEPPPEAPSATLVAPTIQQFPETIPSLYNASRHIMFILFPPSCPTPTSISLKGMTPDGSEMSLSLPVTEFKGNTEDGSVIHILAARTLLGELQEGRLEIQQKESGNSALPDAVKQEGIRIGVKYNLASQWTSFVAVDENKVRLKRSAAEQLNADHDDGAVYEEKLHERYSDDESFGIAVPSPPPTVQYSALSLSEPLQVSTGRSKAASKVKKTVGGRIAGLAGTVFGSSAPAPRRLAAPPAPPAAPAAAAPVPTPGGAYISADSFAPLDARRRQSDHSKERLVAPQPTTVNISSEASRKTALSDEEKLHAIVVEQSSSGAFPSDNSLAKSIGFDTVAAVKDKLPRELKTVSLEIWMTVLVCVFLEKKLAGEKEAWELVVEKAWAYVTSKVDKDTLDRLKKAASDTISV